jgi:hypothetical protein
MSGMITALRHRSHPDCRAPLIQIDAPHAAKMTPLLQAKLMLDARFKQISSLLHVRRRLVIRQLRRLNPVLLAQPATWWASDAWRRRAAARAARDVYAPAPIASTLLAKQHQFLLRERRWPSATQICSLPFYT